jgi:hypothetical protein
MPKHIVALPSKPILKSCVAEGATPRFSTTRSVFTDSGELKSGINTKEMIEPKIRNAALNKIGKVPGAR